MIANTTNPPRCRGITKYCAVRSSRPSTHDRAALKTTLPSTTSLDRAAAKSPLQSFGSTEIRSEAIPAPVTSRPGSMILTAPAASSDRHTAVKLARAAGLPVSIRCALGKRAPARKFWASLISSTSVAPRATSVLGGGGGGGAVAAAAGGSGVGAGDSSATELRTQFASSDRTPEVAARVREKDRSWAVTAIFELRRKIPDKDRPPALAGIELIACAELDITDTGTVGADR